MTQARKWFLELIEAEGRCTGYFGTATQHGGTTVWDHMDGFTMPTNWTEKDILDEFYVFTMRLLETRP